MSALLNEASVLDFLCYCEVADCVEARGVPVTAVDPEFADVARRFATAARLPWPPRQVEAGEFYLGNRDQIDALLDAVRQRSEPPNNQKGST